MRPHGELRQAIGKAARALAAERAAAPLYSVTGERVAAATWREISARACVGFAAGRRTIDNMRRAGELGVVGALKVEGVRRPMSLYAPAAPSATPVTLDRVLRGWPRV